MTYPSSHWQEVARLYKSIKISPHEVTGGKTEETVIIAKMQNRYPDRTIKTVQDWVNRCKRDGLV